MLSLLPLIWCAIVANAPQTGQPVSSVTNNYCSVSCPLTSYPYALADSLLTSFLLNSSQRAWGDCEIEYDSLGRHYMKPIRTFASHAEMAQTARVVPIPVLILDTTTIDGYSFEKDIRCYARPARYGYEGFVLKNNVLAGMVRLIRYGEANKISQIDSWAGCDDKMVTYSAYLKYRHSFFYWADTSLFSYVSPKGVPYVYVDGKGWITVDAFFYKEIPITTYRKMIRRDNR